MACTKYDISGFSVIVCESPNFKPWDKAPEGYLQWHEWADVQHKSGLQQKQCGRCGLWHYPQEMSNEIDVCEMQSKSGPVDVYSVVCLKCASIDRSRKIQEVSG